MESVCNFEKRLYFWNFEKRNFEKRLYFTPEFGEKQCSIFGEDLFFCGLHLH